MHPVAKAALIALALIGFAAPALAAEARAIGNEPVRSGPGDAYEVVDQLLDGSSYEVEECTGRALWCRVMGPTAADAGNHSLGWVRGSQLDGSGAKLMVMPVEFPADATC